MNGVGPLNSKIMFVGEAPGRNELSAGIPFVGRTGDEFLHMLVGAGLLNVSVLQHLKPDKNSLGHMFKNAPPAPFYFTNVADTSGYPDIEKAFFANKTEAKKEKLNLVHGLYPKPNLGAGLARLQNEISAVEPNIIVAMGNLALWALTGEGGTSGITKWRGSTLPSIYLRPDGTPYKVVVILHPASTFRVYANKVLINHDLRTRVLPYLDDPTLPNPGYEYTIRPSFERARAWLKNSILAMNDGVTLLCAADIETRKRQFISCIGFSTNAKSAICIPFLTRSDDHQYWTLEQEQAIMLLMRDFLTHPNLDLIWHNAPFDRQVLTRLWCIRPQLHADTMTMHHTCFPLLRKSLAFVASLYNEHYRFWKEDAKVDQKDDEDLKLDEDQFWTYNCDDARATFEAYTHLEPLIKEMKVDGPYEIQASLHPITYKMTQKGVLVDQRARANAQNMLIDQILELEKWFEYVVGFNVESKTPNPWYRSHTQIATLFYKWFNVPPIFDKKKKDSVTTADWALEEVKKREPLLRELCQHLQEYRSLRIFLTNYCQSKLFFGRMLCQVNIDGTETFRFSTQKTAFDEGLNMQTLSKGTEE